MAFLDERRKQREHELEDEKFDVGTAACSKGLFSFSKRPKSEKVMSSDDKLTISETKSNYDDSVEENGGEDSEISQTEKDSKTIDTEGIDSSEP